MGWSDSLGGSAGDFDDSFNEAMGYGRDDDNDNDSAADYGYAEDDALFAELEAIEDIFSAMDEAYESGDSFVLGGFDVEPIYTMAEEMIDGVNQLSPQLEGFEMLGTGEIYTPGTPEYDRVRSIHQAVEAYRNRPSNLQTTTLNDARDTLLGLINQFETEDFTIDQIDQLTKDLGGFTPAEQDLFDDPSLNPEVDIYLNPNTNRYEAVPDGGYIVADNVTWDPRIQENRFATPQDIDAAVRALENQTLDNASVVDLGDGRYQVNLETSFAGPSGARVNTFTIDQSVVNNRYDVDQDTGVISPASDEDEVGDAGTFGTDELSDADAGQDFGYDYPETFPEADIEVQVPTPDFEGYQKSLLKDVPDIEAETALLNALPGSYQVRDGEIYMDAEFVNAYQDIFGQSPLTGETVISINPEYSLDDLDPGYVDGVLKSLFGEDQYDIVKDLPPEDKATVITLKLDQIQFEGDPSNEDQQEVDFPPADDAETETTTETVDPIDYDDEEVFDFPPVDPPVDPETATDPQTEDPTQGPQEQITQDPDLTPKEDAEQVEDPQDVETSDPGESGMAGGTSGFQGGDDFTAGGESSFDDPADSEEGAGDDQVIGPIAGDTGGEGDAPGSLVTDGADDTFADLIDQIIESGPIFGEGGDDDTTQEGDDTPVGGVTGTPGATGDPSQAGGQVPVNTEEEQVTQEDEGDISTMPGVTDPGQGGSLGDGQDQVGTTDPIETTEEGQQTETDTEVDSDTESTEEDTDTGLDLGVDLETGDDTGVDTGVDTEIDTGTDTTGEAEEDDTGGVEGDSTESGDSPIEGEEDQGVGEEDADEAGGEGVTEGDAEGAGEDDPVGIGGDVEGIIEGPGDGIIPGLLPGDDAGVIGEGDGIVGGGEDDDLGLGPGADEEGEGEGGEQVDSPLGGGGDGGVDDDDDACGPGFVKVDGVCVPEEVEEPEPIEPYNIPTTVDTFIPEDDFEYRQPFLGAGLDPYGMFGQYTLDASSPSVGIEGSYLPQYLGIPGAAINAYTASQTGLAPADVAAFSSLFGAPILPKPKVEPFGGN